MNQPEDWFSGDQHLDHAKLLLPVLDGGEARPFSTVEDMNERLAFHLGAGGLQNPRLDTLWLMGDVAYAKPALEPFMEAIRPFWYRINLIIGNHDYKLRTHERTDLFNDIHDSLVMVRNGRTIHLSHYPYESWCGSSHGSVHIHAHTHGHSRQLTNRVDTGVMLHKYKALPLSRILSYHANQIHP